MIDSALGAESTPPSSWVALVGQRRGGAVLSQAATGAGVGGGTRTCAPR